jgi:putative FmdB family regulatory protein
VPIYEYECTKCKHRFEVIQKFSDRGRTRCPKCKGALRKLISAPAIHFKGSGWYVTDYGKGNAAGTNKKPLQQTTKEDPGMPKAPKDEEKPKTPPKEKAKTKE